MLFTYSSDFAAHNWLHDVIFGELQSSMLLIDNGQNTIDWPAWLPAEYHAQLAGRRGLRDHIAVFREAYVNLAPAERAIVYEALISHNSIPDNLKGLVACSPKSTLPIAIQQPTSTLFEYAFDLLTEIGSRDEQYEVIYNAAPFKVCPFCGIHQLDSIGAPREDLDHYLLRSKYPFCGANLNNLAPMCSKCNSRYKKTQDVIFDDDLNIACKASDPFSGPTFRIGLNGTPSYDGTSLFPEWRIQIQNGCQEANTWNRVFKIEERYIRDVLSPNFGNWIRDFGRWGARMLNKIPNMGELKAALCNYINDEKLKGFADTSFLKVSVFCMFLSQLENNNTDLQLWLGDQIDIYL